MMQLVTQNNGIIPLDMYTINGVADSEQIVKNYFSQPYDSVFIESIMNGTDSAYIKVYAIVQDNNPNAYIWQDSLAYILENIFADNPASNNNGGMGKEIRQTGRNMNPNMSDNPIFLTIAPNPFNARTQVVFSIPVVDENQIAEVKVYNMLSQDVTTLVNDIRPSGSYAVTFDGSNLPSGDYLISVHLANHTQSKMVVLEK